MRREIHPDMLAAFLSTVQFYGGADDPVSIGAYRRGLAAALAWMERHETEEREHGRRHAEAAREMQTLIQLAEARRRAASHGGAT